VTWTHRPARRSEPLAESWPGGGHPHFASIVLGRVPLVSEETSDITSPGAVADEAASELAFVDIKAQLAGDGPADD